MTTAKALQLNIIFIATEPFKLIWYQCPKIVRVGYCEICLKTLGKSYYTPSGHMVTENVNHGWAYGRDLENICVLTITF